MPAEYGWRFAFIIGGVLGFLVLLLRRFLPESPRWLMTHGQPEEAERVVAEIERRVERETGQPLPPVPGGAPAANRRACLVRAGTSALFTTYRPAVLGIALMAAQAFCYNAVFFTYALILTRFYQWRPAMWACSSCPSPSATSWGRCSWDACSTPLGGA